METPLIILGVAGSLRTSSFNRAALLAAQQVTPAGVRLDVADIDGIRHTKFDAQGRLTDAATRNGIRELLDELTSWTRRLQPSDPVSSLAAVSPCSVAGGVLS